MYIYIYIYIYICLNVYASLYIYCDAAVRAPLGAFRCSSTQTMLFEHLKHAVRTHEGWRAAAMGQLRMLTSVGLNYAGDDHLPLDVIDFVEKAPAVMSDLTSTVLLAVLKESAFTDVAFKGYTANFVASSAVETPEAERINTLRPRMVKASGEAANDPRYHLQVKQMAMQGVGRYIGSCRTMSVCGVVEKVEGAKPTANAESLGEGVVRLGNTNLYKIVDEDTSGTFARFCKDCVGVQGMWEQALASNDTHEVVRLLGDIVERANIPAWFMGERVKDPSCYAGAFVARKLFLVCWLFGGLRGNVKWDALTLPEMLRIMPDETDKMTEFPQDWSAADVSWFMHRRPDRFPFSSMWGCLFNGVADKWSMAPQWHQGTIAPRALKNNKK